MKKLLCVLLAIIMIMSSVITSSAFGWQDPGVITVDEAVKEHELKTGEKVETNRYYFLMPNGSNGDLGDDDSVDETGYPLGHFGEYSESWFTTLSDGSPATNTACIYWWDSRVADPPSWVGYLPSGVDVNDPCVFYADVPKAVTTIIWNNGVDGGMDTTQDIYFCTAQTVNIPCEYYDPGESPNYPYGLDSFDNMIYVLDPYLIRIWENVECGGEWYYYYGDGCYGFAKDGTKANCLRNDHYDADGNHTEAGETDVVKGDVDNDGNLSIADATLIQRFVAHIDEFSEEQEKCADIDNNSAVTIFDATKVQIYLVGYRE